MVIVFIVLTLDIRLQIAGIIKERLSISGIVVKDESTNINKEVRVQRDDKSTDEDDDESASEKELL
jgi:hypothetical protein